MKLTPEILLQAYAGGLFPMAEDARGTELLWFDPSLRGIIPLDAFHVPHRLARTMRATPFDVRFDTAFTDVMKSCGAQTPGRPTTWINDEILSLYTALFTMGHAHSVEIWDGEALVGGLYGVHLGGAFFGESMFSRRTDASKIALVHLVHHLQTQDFTLLDTQYLTTHLAQFGAIEIPRAAYRRLLRKALEKPVAF